jgi:hypothetical protein
MTRPLRMLVDAAVIALALYVILRVLVIGAVTAFPGVL